MYKTINQTKQILGGVNSFVYIYLPFSVSHVCACVCVCVCAHLYSLIWMAVHEPCVVQIPWQWPQALDSTEISPLNTVFIRWWSESHTRAHCPPNTLLEGPSTDPPPHGPQCNPAACTVCIKPLCRASSAGGAPKQPLDNPYVNSLHLTSSQTQKVTYNPDGPTVMLDMLLCFQKI